MSAEKPVCIKIHPTTLSEFQAMALKQPPADPECYRSLFHASQLRLDFPYGQTEIMVASNLYLLNRN